MCLIFKKVFIKHFVLCSKVIRTKYILITGQDVEIEVLIKKVKDESLSRQQCNNHS